MGLMGLSTRFSSAQHNVAMYQSVKDMMVKYHLNAIRIGSSDMFNNNYPYNNGQAIEWFLDNTDATVIIDRHHTIGTMTLNTAQLTTINENLAEMGDTYAYYGDRAQFEAYNEYGGLDFYVKMQSILDKFRALGFKQWMIFNRMGLSESKPDTLDYWASIGGWKKINDPMNKTKGGHHFYGNRAIATNDYGKMCFDALMKGFTITGQPMCCTEIGADYNEINAFTAIKVVAVNRLLKLSSDVNWDSFVWMREGLANLPTYERLGLVFPIPPNPLQDCITAKGILEKQIADLTSTNNTLNSENDTLKLEIQTMDAKIKKALLDLA